MMQTQARICPECGDDHGETVACGKASPVRVCSLLVDLPNHVHADWHAVGDRAAETTLRRLEALAAKIGTTSVMVALEAGVPTFRHALASSYKSNRKATPDAVIEQLLQAAELCRENEWDVISVAGFEADDVIATACRIASEYSTRVVIASSDKDMCQLLRSREVTICKKAKSVYGRLDCDWWTADRLYEDKGLRPYQWIDYQAMCGDSTDNIAGCPGVGDVTATAILRAAGTLYAAFANPWKLPILDRQRNKLMAWKPRSELAKQLVTLRADVPMEWVP